MSSSLSRNFYHTEDIMLVFYAGLSRLTAFAVDIWLPSGTSWSKNKMINKSKKENVAQKNLVFFKFSLSECAQTEQIKNGRFSEKDEFAFFQRPEGLNPGWVVGKRKHRLSKSHIERKLNEIANLKRPWKSTLKQTKNLLFRQIARPTILGIFRKF